MEVIDALSVLFLHLSNDKPSFLSLAMCLVVSRTRSQSFQGCIRILGILGHSNLLGFVVVLSYLLQNCPRCALLVLTSSSSFMSSASMFLSSVSRLPTPFFLIIIYLLHIMPYILNQFRSVFCSSKLIFVNHLACF